VAASTGRSDICANLDVLARIRTAKVPTKLRGDLRGIWGVNSNSIPLRGKHLTRLIEPLPSTQGTLAAALFSLETLLSPGRRATLGRDQSQGGV
jgi:hypothetical protein